MGRSGDWPYWAFLYFMKCDACGNESDFDAAFIKERKSWHLSPRTVCPSCWVRRNNAQGSRFLWLLLAAGICGYVLNWVAPGNFIGHFLLNLFLIGLFLVFSILPHELGHAIVARTLGWRVYQIVIGVGKPLFKWRCFGILFDLRTIPLAGATWMTPTNTRWFRTKRFMAVLAGPAVNIAMAMAVVVGFQGSLRNFDFDALPPMARLFVWANVWVALINLWPHQSKTGFALPSDGKQLLQTLSITKEGIQQVQALRFAFEATICREQSDYAGTRMWCDKGLALYPEDPHLLNLSGINHLNEQNYETARQVFLKLLAKENQPAGLRFVLLNNLAYADALSGNPALIGEADAYSRDAHAGLPWAPAVIGTRGTVLVAMGAYEEGMKLLKRSMDDAESPRSKAENACHMANALAQTDRRDEARKYLTLARQLDPKCMLLARTAEIVGGTSGG
jgi:hypothetical protein